MEWARIRMIYITETMDRELLVRNEYLAAENRILRNQLKGRPRLLDDEIGHRLGARPSVRWRLPVWYCTEALVSASSKTPRL
jgi:hypothetical protein